MSHLPPSSGSGRDRGKSAPPPPPVSSASSQVSGHPVPTSSSHPQQQHHPQHHHTHPNHPPPPPPNGHVNRTRMVSTSASSTAGNKKLDLEGDVGRAIELLDKLQRTEYAAWMGRDVGMDKLRSLQRVLQSDLFTNVRQVYEQVYGRVDLQGSPDMKANATAKATVAVLAASEGPAASRQVILPKTDEGLGFNIMGGREQGCPVYVSRIMQGGIAERRSDLRRGDQLVSVNGVSVEGETHEKVVSLLKAAKDVVTLLVRYHPRMLDMMEHRFDNRRH